MGLDGDHEESGDDPPGASTTANALGDGMFAGSLARVSLTLQRKGGLHLCQPVLSILSHASMALWRSIRLRVCGTGGRGGTQLEERTQNNTLCNRSKEF